MEQNLHGPEVYDFRQYDRIWQRVAPGLEPYQAGEQSAPAARQEAGLVPAQQAARQESQLPGAQIDPCCMGSAAAEMLEVLAGFIEEELEDQSALRALLRCAPVWAVARLRELAAEEGEHARRLMAVWYLITGQCYHTQSVASCRNGGMRWCEALRERYHNAACNGLNYLRAADGTTDPCLAKLLRDLSDASYRQAEILLRMLEKSLRM